MSKFHEAIKNAKKTPKRSATEKRLKKREKKAIKIGSPDIKKIFENRVK